MTITRIFLLLLLAVCCAVAASPAQAQESEKAFYAGKTVRVRGFVDRMNGYEIEIAVPEDIELVPATQLRSTSE